MNINHLALSWSTSRGADTYGYNICRLDDRQTDKRYRCMGGGYDMVGTVFGDWLEEVFQDRLRKIAHRASYIYNPGAGMTRKEGADTLYGMTVHLKDGELSKVTLDGGCGIESMIRIAEAIGLEVQSEYSRGRNCRRLGFYVVEVAA